MRCVANCKIFTILYKHNTYIGSTFVLPQSVGGGYMPKPITNTVMNCYDNIIGIKGLCDTQTYRYYLDDYGFSLLGLSKISDEKQKTGKALFDNIISKAWRAVIDDIEFSGLDVNKILSEATVGTVENTALPPVAGLNGVTFTLDKHCNLARFYISEIRVNVKVGSATPFDVVIEQAGVQQVVFSGVVGDDKVVYIPINDFILDNFKVLVDTTNIQVNSGSTASSCACSSMFDVSSSNNNNNFGIEVDLQVRCDKQKHICKFIDLVAPLVIQKAMAMVYFDMMTTNRINDFVSQKKIENAAEMVAFYDSDMNPLKYAVQGVGKSPALGQYQLALAKLKIPAPKCRCCVECVGNSVVVSIP